MLNMNKILFYCLLSINLQAFEDAYLLLPKLEPEDGGYGKLLEVKYRNLGIKKFTKSYNWGKAEESEIVQFFQKYCEGIYTVSPEKFDDLFKKDKDFFVTPKTALESASKWDAIYLYGLLEYKSEIYMVGFMQKEDSEYNSPIVKRVVKEDGEWKMIVNKTNVDLYALTRLLSLRSEATNLPIALREISD